MGLASPVVKLYYKHEHMLLKNSNALNPAIPSLTLKIGPLSEHVDMISAHFPPPRQCLPPDHVSSSSVLAHVAASAGNTFPPDATAAAHHGAFSY